MVEHREVNGSDGGWGALIEVDYRPRITIVLGSHLSHMEHWKLLAGRRRRLQRAPTLTSMKYHRAGERAPNGPSVP